MSYGTKVFATNSTMCSPNTSVKAAGNDSKASSDIFLFSFHLRSSQLNHAFIYQFISKKSILEVE